MKDEETFKPVTRGSVGVTLTGASIFIEEVNVAPRISPVLVNVPSSSLIEASLKIGED